MKRKLLFIVLAAVMAFSCAMGFAACETHTHNMTHHPAEAATCTEDGNVEYWSCDGCGKYFADENGSEEITTIVIPATGHTYSEEWTYDETDHWHAATCGHDEEVKDKAEHTWNSGEITTEPTCTESGVKTYTCTVCGATKTEAVSATGHTYSDKWSYDENYHWRAATCGHNEETNDKSEHTLVDGICTVCDAFIGTKGLEYTLSDDETYYIVSGIGTAVDTNIIIPDAYSGKPVTAISSQAFYQNQTIRSVAIPDSVTTIGSYAFRECASLSDVTIGSGVQVIEKQAFAKCASLENVVIKDGVVMIGETMFWECPLTKIIIPDSVTSIGTNAFRDCASLSDVIIGSGVESIGGMAFYGCPIERAVVSASAMDNYMQENGTLPGEASYLIAPGHLKTLILMGEGEMADYLLFGYNQLVTLVICKGITSIGNSAFSRCISLKSIVIPDSVLSVGSSVANDCDALEAVYYGGTKSDWNNMDIDSGNTKLTDAARYYYSETQPAEDGNFWHYGEDGIMPVVWTKEQ